MTIRRAKQRVFKPARYAVLAAAVLLSGVSSAIAAPCPSQSVTWYGSNGEVCEGMTQPMDDVLPDSLDFDTNIVENTNSGFTGQAAYVCHNGAVVEAGSAPSGYTYGYTPYCTAVAAVGCPAQNVSWDQDGHVCYGNVGALADGGNATINDGVAPTTGSASYACANGTLTRQPGATCTGPVVPPTNNCVGTSTTWTVGLNTCASNIPDLAHGASVTIYDNAQPTTGSAMMTCNNGIFSRSAEACVSTSPPTCPPPPPPPPTPVTIYSGCYVDTPWWDLVSSPNCQTGVRSCTTTDGIGFSIGTHMNNGGDAYYFNDPERYTVSWSGACTGTGSYCGVQSMPNGTHTATVTVTDTLTGQVTTRSITATKNTVKRVNINECPEML